jgi:hypothetical protein
MGVQCNRLKEQRYGRVLIGQKGWEGRVLIGRKGWEGRVLIGRQKQRLISDWSKTFDYSLGIFGRFRLKMD